MRLFLFFFVLVFSLSCQQAQQSAEMKYFDLSGLIKQQIGLLKRDKPAVFKRIILGTEKEEITLDSLNWDKELALFTQADINKKAYSASYTTSEHGNEVEYKLKPGESLPVTSLKVVFDERKAPLEVYISTVTSNFLTNAQRKLSINLENGRISAYGINSEQELFIGDPEKIEISGRILYKSK